VHHPPDRPGALADEASSGVCSLVREAVLDGSIRPHAGKDAWPALAFE